MLPQVIRNPLCALWMETPVLKESWSSKKIKIKRNVSLQACSRSSHPLLCRVIVERPRLNKILRRLIWSWVIVNKQLPHFAAGLGGARCPGAVGVIPAGTNGCYNPPGTAARSCASAAGPEVCWSGYSERCCSPTLRGRAGNCRPWSRWRWDCGPGEPRRFCTVSWT